MNGLEMGKRWVPWLPFGLVVVALLTLGWARTAQAQTQPACPCSLWSNGATPAVASASDPGAVELGVKFRADVDGYVTGLRFYKRSGDGGPHVGNLWTSTGTLLASVPFTNESASGWQQVDLPTPVAISANTTYIASYYTDMGGYALSPWYFTTSGVQNGPLRTLADGEDGGNGVYRYGASGFPTSSFEASNYWADVVFTTTIVPDTTPSVLSGVNATPTTTTAAIPGSTLEDDDSRVLSGTSSSSLTQSATNGTMPTSRSITLTGATENTTSALTIVGNRNDVAGNCVASWRIEGIAGRAPAENSRAADTSCSGTRVE
jgi:hypothetical protein